MVGILMPGRGIAVLGIALLGIVTVACGGDPAPSNEPGPPPGLAIVGAQLIDGTGGAPVADSVIVVRDGRIHAAGPRATTEVPLGAEVVDAAGKTVIPGLVDLHRHYGGPLSAAEQALKSQLYYGVTTTRSIGSDDPEKVALMLEANAGRPDLPRAFTAGRGFSFPDGFNAGTANTPTSAEEARELVREQAALGVHFTKMWVNEVPNPGLKIPPEIRAAIVDESIKNGLIPVAHIDEEADGIQLLEAGLSDFSPQHRQNLWSGSWCADGRPRAQPRVSTTLSGERLPVYPDPVYQPQQLALRRAPGASGGLRAAGRDESRRAGEF